MVCMLLTKDVTNYLRQLKRNGCTTTRDNDAGVAEARDGDQIVFKALQKGQGQHWIVRYLNSDRIQWDRSTPC
jgi:hypothetical protein